LRAGDGSWCWGLRRSFFWNAGGTRTWNCQRAGHASKSGGRTWQADICTTATTLGRGWTSAAGLRILANELPLRVDGSHLAGCCGRTEVVAQVERR